MATRSRGNNMPAARSMQHPRPHPNSSKTTSSAQNQDSTSSQKQTPNHLKSTNVSKQQSKRPTPGDSSTYVRRSTFEDPSSSSTAQNTRVISFSSKSATTQRSTVPARKQSTSQYTRPASGVKKRFIYVKKQDIGTSTAATPKEKMRIPPEKVEVPDSHDVKQPEQNPKDRESSINEEETKADVSVKVAPEPISNEDTKEENIDKDVDLKNDCRQDITLEETNNVNQELPEASNINEIDSSNKTHENVAGNPTSEAEEMNKEPEKTLLSPQKEAVGGESEEVPETKETEARDEKRETENVAAKTQVAKAKRESVVSNDVIEETASKLREQRKNKVKALAGAFETVISLQEQK